MWRIQDFLDEEEDDNPKGDIANLDYYFGHFPPKVYETEKKLDRKKGRASLDPPIISQHITKFAQYKKYIKALGFMSSSKW